jgi:enamine deaminase RidA (YjgF/YER057c/UK114 family)
MERYSSGAPWEQKFGYCRAIKAGNIIEVSGTVSSDKNGFALGKNAKDQTANALKIIEKALEHFGANRKDVIRTRVYCIDLNHWPKIADAHSTFFGKNRPASTLLEVQSLVTKDFLVEIEATAILHQD